MAVYAVRQWNSIDTSPRGENTLSVYNLLFTIQWNKREILEHESCTYVLDKAFKNVVTQNENYWLRHHTFKSTIWYCWYYYWGLSNENWWIPNTDDIIFMNKAVTDWAKSDNKSKKQICSYCNNLVKKAISW